MDQVNQVNQLNQVSQVLLGSSDYTALRSGYMGHGFVLQK